MAATHKPIGKTIPFSVQERDYLTSEYLQKFKSADEIADKNSVSVRLVHSRIKFHEISKLYRYGTKNVTKNNAFYCHSCGQSLVK